MGISNRLNVGIRGSYPRRSANILLLEDGTPIAPAPYLSPEAYYNPPSDRLDGIEILKGADILSYGANTMYGVVNYITKKPPVKPTLGLNIVGGYYKCTNPVVKIAHINEMNLGSITAEILGYYVKPIGAILTFACITEKTVFSVVDENFANCLVGVDSLLEE